jgi:hypothetical protein
MKRSVRGFLCATVTLSVSHARAQATNPDEDARALFTHSLCFMSQRGW